SVANSSRHNPEDPDTLETRASLSNESVRHKRGSSPTRGRSNRMRATPRTQKPNNGAIDPRSAMLPRLFPRAHQLRARRHRAELRQRVAQHLLGIVLRKSRDAVARQHHAIAEIHRLDAGAEDSEIDRHAGRNDRLDAE